MGSLLKVFKILLFISIIYSFIYFSCSEPEKEKPNKIIDIKVSKNGYEPKEIFVKRGDVVLFKITALDEGIGDDYSQQYYGHCFYILPPYDVGVYNIKSGETKILKVKMLYPGDFLFTCPYCSGFFPTKGTIHVKWREGEISPF